MLQEHYETLASRGEDLAKSYPGAGYLYLAGLGYLQSSQWDKAREEWNEVLQRYPNRPERGKAEIRIADSYYMEGNVEEALNHYLSIYKKQRKSAWRHYLFYRLGQCYQKIGNRKEAEWYFGQVKNQYPNSPESGWVKNQLQEGPLFSVQVGVFSSKKNSHKMENLLLEKGFRSYIVESSEGGETLYHIRVGELPTHEEAERLQAELKEHGFSTKIYP